jgi:hypothetical protein
VVTSHETLEKCSILFKVKEGDDFKHRNTRLVFRGLESEPDAEIGQKGTFFKGLGTSGFWWRKLYINIRYVPPSNFNN